MRPLPSAAIASPTAAVSRRGSMRIAGASTTSAPSSASRAARPLACARARVTATLRPKQRRALEPGQPLAQRRHRPDDGDRGRPDARRPRPARRSPPACAVTVRWPGSVPRSTTAAGSAAGRPCSISARRDRGQRAHAHVEDERAREGRQRRPVERALGLGRILVRGHEGDRRGLVAVGDRDARVGGCGDAGGHAGHDLERHARLGERLGLLAAAAEHERVAALQAHHPLALRAHARRAARLISSCADAGVAGLLADVDQLGVRPRVLAAAARDQAVVDDHVGPRDQLERAHGHEPRVAGPGADQVDDPLFGSRSRAYGEVEARRSSSPAPALSIRSRQQLSDRGGVAGVALDAVGDPLAAVRQPGIARTRAATRRRSREDAPTGVWQLASSAPDDRALGIEPRACDGS